MQVVLGEHDQDDETETISLTMDIRQKFDHPDYNIAARFDNDFSMLELEGEVDLCRYPNIRPVCLPSASSSDTFVGDVATVTGWGVTDYQYGDSSNVLLEVNVTVITNEECRNDYMDKDKDTITDYMLCADVPEGGKDSCSGDSGGPLVTAKQGDGTTPGQNYQLIGVVSWGWGCADPRYPGVYARVTSQLTWIQSFLSQSGKSCPAV